MPSESNWLLLISYDGTNYNGWQVQPNQPTIEGTLENALHRLTGQVVKVRFRANRCRGPRSEPDRELFVVSEFSPEKWRIALNGVLPDDLVVKHVQQVPRIFMPDTHRSGSAIVIWSATCPTVLLSAGTKAGGSENP